MYIETSKSSCTNSKSTDFSNIFNSSLLYIKFFSYLLKEQLNESSKRNISHEIDEIVEDNEDYEECSYIVENEEMINDGEMEETIEESDNQEESPVFKKLKTEQKSDSLDEALEYINSDQLSENNSEINLQSESSDHNQDNIVYIKGSPQEEGVQSDNDHTVSFPHKYLRIF